MNDPISAREALLIEAIGEAGKLMDSVEKLMPVLHEMTWEIAQAASNLRENLVAFESRVSALTETAKVRTVQHVLARTDEATRRSIALQSSAMADAARAALGAEFSATMQRLQSAVQLLVERQGQRWERWLTHTAAAATGSAVTWTLLFTLWAR